MGETQRCDGVKVVDTPLSGLVLIESPIFRDDRGTFQRLHCSESLAALGLPCHFVQTNLATNVRSGTLRGMHFQRAPHEEDKLVRCIAGAVLDVVIDIRASSPTFGKHFSVELSAERAHALLVPKGFAHGYLTLTDGAVVLYHVTAAYQPAAEGGIRWSDPGFGIQWPIARPQLSAKDAAWPDYADRPGP